MTVIYEITYTKTAMKSRNKLFLLMKLNSVTSNFQQLVLIKNIRSGITFFLMRGSVATICFYCLVLFALILSLVCN